MLETLHTVPWHDLDHAYGTATDVPDLIRALASPDKQVRKETMWQLWSSVTHQGTVYSVTPYVVPFFCELLEAPDVEQKSQLLYYLATIACGASYFDVHVRESERRETPEMQKKIAEELSWVQATSDAVSDGYQTYLALLDDPDLDVREGAAYTLSRCQSHAEQVVPIIKQRYANTHEKNQVRASLILSLGQLCPQDTESSQFFHEALHRQQDAFLRVAIAIGGAFCLREQTSQEILTILLHSYELPQKEKDRFSELSFAEDDQDTCVSTALRMIGLSIAPLVIPTLIQNVRYSDRSSGLSFVDNLLFFVMAGQKIKRHMTIADLSDIQRDALRVIAETDDLWYFGNMSFTVGAYFDPIFPSTSSDEEAIWDQDDVKAFLAGEKVFR